VRLLRRGRGGGRGGTGLERHSAVLPSAPRALVAAVQLNLLQAEQAHAVPAIGRAGSKEGRGRVERPNADEGVEDRGTTALPGPVLLARPCTA